MKLFLFLNHLICLYNNKFYKFVNYFKIAITTFTKLSLRAFPMRSNPTLITMWLQPIVCSFHLVLFFGLLTQGACQRHAERLPLVVRKSAFPYLDYSLTEGFSLGLRPRSLRDASLCGLLASANDNFYHLIYLYNNNYLKNVNYNFYIFCYLSKIIDL